METPAQPAPPLNDEVDGPANTLTTTKQIEANRRNAQFSTGPKSPEGKKIVAGNARKHGLLAKDLVIVTGGGKENQGAFDDLLSQLRDYYKPVGMAEDLCVQELAASYWKSARALRCERGEVTLTGTVYPESPDLTPLEEDFLPQPDSNARDVLLQSSRGITRDVLLQSSRGINYLLKKLDQAQNELESKGFLPPESVRFLPQNPGQSWRRACNKGVLLTALENEKEQLQARKLLVEEEERNRRDARIDAAAIPPKTALDRIHRYETSNLRHRYKVEKRLEELQSRRKEQARASGVLNPGEGFFAKQSQDVL
jgi:hypothetical protein